MAPSLVTAPAKEPLSLQEVKDHLRIHVPDEDAYLRRLVKVVRVRAERATRRALLTQTWDVLLDSWPTWDGYHGGRMSESSTLLPSGGFIWLPKSPLQTVTYVHYIDLAGVTQTWDPSNYLVDAPRGDYAARGRLALGWVKVWPVIQPVMNAVRIRMVCGYGDDASDVPELLKQAMLLDAGTLHDGRSTILSQARAQAIVIPTTSVDIYRSFRSL